jgi:hypothetical protein
MLAPPGDPAAGMPAVTNAMLARVPIFRYLILLAERPEEIEAGKFALDGAGINTRVLDQASYDGKSFSVKYLILERLDNAVSTPASLRP